MSKQAKGTVNVWLSSGAHTKPSELHKLDDEELVDVLFLQNADMSSYGWTRVGTAEVIITLDDRKTVTANQVVMLQSQLKEMRAEHQQAQNRLTKQIQELLAIDNEVQEMSAQYAGTPTGTGKALPACLARALAPMAPPQSVIHQIIQEDDLLAADRALNVDKAERATQANADRALDLQIKFQNLPGAWA